MKLGVVGLPNAGKSTLFNALTAQNALCADYPFCTIEPNVGRVALPDKRLDVLADMHKSKKVVPTFVTFVDIAGLVKGASAGAGLGNKFLSHIRETDALVHVVRAFSISAQDESDPAADAEIVNLELALSDLEIVEKRLSKVAKNHMAAEQAAYLKRVCAALEKGLPPPLAQNEAQERLCEELNLITGKKVLYALNLDEKAILDPQALAPVREFFAYCREKNAPVLPVCAKIEEELAALGDDEKAEFLREFGVADADTGLKRIIKAGYAALDLISFLTTGPDETRAWTIKNGAKAPQAAGKIHTDFERGFIRAECVSFEELARYGSYNAAREAGAVRSEGKDYIIKDGDVVNFRFNV